MFVGKPARPIHRWSQPSTNAVSPGGPGPALRLAICAAARVASGLSVSAAAGEEERLSLSAGRWPVQVVPGVNRRLIRRVRPTSACPVHPSPRWLQRSPFVTGFMREIDKDRPGVDWRGLARSSDGLVIYIGPANLRRICESDRR